MNNNQRSTVLNLEKILNLTDQDQQNLLKPLQDLPEEHFVGFEVDPDGNAVARYRFDNGYGARVMINREESENVAAPFMILTVRQDGGATGDSGPAIEFAEWLVAGDMEAIKDKLTEISQLLLSSRTVKQ